MEARFALFLVVARTRVGVMCALSFVWNAGGFVGTVMRGLESH